MDSSTASESCVFRVVPCLDGKKGYYDISKRTVTMVAIYIHIVVSNTMMVKK